MAATVIFRQAPQVLTGAQRALVGAYASDAFPGAIASKMTNLAISRLGPGEGVKAVLFEEGTLTSAQFLSLKRQSLTDPAVRIAIIPGTIVGDNLDAIRRTVGNGETPVPAAVEDPPGDLTQLRTLLTTIFGLSATNAANVHSVSFSRAIGETDVTGAVQWRQVVTGPQWLAGIAAGTAATELYQFEIGD